MKSQQEQALRAKVEQVRGRLQGLTADLRVVDDEVERLAPQRTRHELLDQACSSLEKLGELGASSLFWGEQTAPSRIVEQLRGVRSRVSAFQAQLGELDERRQAILVQVGREEEVLEILGADIYYVREEEERRKLEWVVEREIGPVPPRLQRMAWARGGEDDRRFRRSLAASLLVGLLLGLVFPMIDLPLPKRFVPEEMPERLAQLVRQELVKPIPPPPLVAETPPDQTPPEQQESKPIEQPEPAEQPPQVPAIADAEPSELPGQLGAETPSVAAAAPGKTVEKAGILAFKDEFASLARDNVAPRLGADARYGDAADASRASSAARSMLTTNAPGSSRGIDVSSLSRSVGGGGGGDGTGDGGGGGMQGVQVGRASSSIASIGGGGRPLARGGPGPSRTDEEIQIVFDRYKASFYRLYNRELRNDPTLRGQMVLRLTIEPDGSVSMCKLQSTDMDAPALAAQVVERVLTINFGAKDVEALTIVYPIDFLPAA
ncbi:MAG TPA: AgmX/PglI C-terminal domain-containing protein [Candidatus Polarisedimenticolaceae bacterium]|nr:AgmX/PglI C-terminal domain-containing protein [Candidatus Polarisedimenticolaceae bacterium]